MDNLFFLQVFFSLKLLDKQLELVVSTIARDAAKSFDQIDADIFLPVPSPIEKAGKNPNAESRKVYSEDDVIVWMERISKALRSESILYIEQIWHLSFILSRMRDSETQTLMEDVLREKEREQSGLNGRPYLTPIQVFWGFFTSHLKKRINFSIGKLPEMRPHFSAVFPKIMKVLGIFVNDLLSRPIITSSSSFDEPFNKKKQLLLQSFSDMRILFEQHIQQRLITTTQSCFRGSF